MSKILKYALLITAGFLLAACSPRLAGTWSVQKYETHSPGQQQVILQDIGTITFSKDGSGVKQLEYSVLGMTKKDTLPFQWIAKEKHVTIDSPQSDLGKTWIVSEDKRSFQKWKSTDGTNQVQILELVK